MFKNNKNMKISNKTCAIFSRQDCKIRIPFNILFLFRYYSGIIK